MSQNYKTTQVLEKISTCVRKIKSLGVVKLKWLDK